MDIRKRLSVKDRAILKLVIWTLLIVWMLFWLILSIVIGQVAGMELSTFVGPSIWGSMLRWIAPVWVVFTALLTIIFIARFTSKKL